MIWVLIWCYWTNQLHLVTRLFLRSLVYLVYHVGFHHHEATLWITTPGAACHAGGNNAVQPDKKLKKDALETYGMYDVERIKYQAPARPARHWLGSFWHLQQPVFFKLKLSKMNLWQLMPKAMLFLCVFDAFQIFPTGYFVQESSSTPTPCQVTNGKNAMPAFGERLGPDDIEALRALRHPFVYTGWWMGVPSLWRVRIQDNCQNPQYPQYFTVITSITNV